jgi:hypothetical protein
MPDAKSPDGQDGKTTPNANKCGTSFDSYNVAIFAGDKSPVVIGAVIRHELQHCQQLANHGPDLYRLSNEIYEAIKSDSLTSGKLYNAMPIEVEANAVAAAYARRRFGADAVLALLPRYESLLGPCLAADYETPLDHRMQAFLIAMTTIADSHRP